MKMIRLIFLGCCLFANDTIAQSGKKYKITYTHLFNPAGINRDNSNDLVLRELNVTPSSSTLEAILYGDFEKSNYHFSIGKSNVISENNNGNASLKSLDGIVNQPSNKGSKSMAFIPVLQPDIFGNMVFWDKKMDSIHVREKMIYSYVLNTEHRANINWDISSIAKKIKEFNCIKATANFRGRNYIAWFTTDIPIVDGPWKFKGLPGLVMEIIDESNQVGIFIEKIEYPSQSQIPPFFAKGKRVTHAEYVEYLNNENKKFRDYSLMLLQNQPGIEKSSIKPVVEGPKETYYIERKKD